MKRFYSSSLLFLAFAIYSTFSFSQNEVLPKGLTESENEIISQFQFKNSRVTAPPSTPVRTMAEWEEVEYLVVTWEPNFQNILRQIVEVGVTECNVIIVTQNEGSVSSYLTNAGIDLTNITFLNQPWDSIWVRDYGGNTIYSNDVGDRGIIDWIYNRPRPNDDVVPEAYAGLLGLPFYSTNSGTNDLVNTGGNFMSDGLGNAFASKLILNENQAGNPYGVSVKNEDQINEIMSNYMGISNFIKMNTLPYDGIHHIDMHMKLLDEETILVSQYPDGVADGPQIEANIEYVLNNFQSPFGDPYNIKWIPAPPSTSGAYPDTGGSYRTYSNSLFLNKSILVPTYRPEVDDQALAYYQELMPGYNIVGIDVDNPGENIISLLGAIHCITHTIGVADPLWIVHQPIVDAMAESTVSVNASIEHNSGINSAKVFWREIGDTNFNETTMSFVSDNMYTADIPTPSSGNDIEYYIWAEANSGKTLTRPIVAPEGYWTMNVSVLSVEEWAENNISAAYPNPTYGNVSFKLNNINEPMHISIYNVMGQLLFEKDIKNANGIVELELKPSWKGSLFVTFEGNFGKINKKIIKL